MLKQVKQKLAMLSKQCNREPEILLKILLKKNQKYYNVKTS